MNISIITQNEDFFFKDNFENFILNLPRGISIKSVFLCSASPFGVKLNLFQKFIKTFKTFGFNFTLRYSMKFIISKFFKENLTSMLYKHKIKVFKINEEITKGSFKYLKNSNLDLIISISCPIILNQEVLMIPSLGCINVHCSLLPKYRGLMPSFWTLFYKEKYTGVSIFLMNEYIDDGPIIYQKKIKVDNLTLEGLINKTKKQSFICLIEVLKKYLNNKIRVINKNQKKIVVTIHFHQKTT